MLELWENYLAQGVRLIQLSNKNWDIVGAVALNELDLRTAVLLTPKTSTERYLLKVGPISIFFSNWAIISE